ncbi:DUF2442 domain-containing protein [Desulfomonile tiedjei]|uniref:DUF2442 domain-containing protein n=1 Tax=Desulfomonile tiedjei (strain ATCC 49306 / DSM 6799 / DCB-1) TaxID=706587 RepID=I4C385_DESTA|nr:DUF2442 domain-containing protein [Desulfomonile tiedjei]AFM24026.1 Protein of unknown function (DUF3532) [Desulfomonile tiedjei DSM 6799]
MLIVGIEFGEREFIIELDNGQKIDVPLRLYPRLTYASPDELRNCRFIGDGEGIHWEDLDEDISIENIFSGEGSHESKHSLRKWLKSRNQLTMGV